MEKIIIKGGHRLAGQVKVGGSIAATLPVMAAAILASSGKVLLTDVPAVAEVQTMSDLLGALSLIVKRDEATQRLTIDASAPVTSTITNEYMTGLAASTLALGPLLARTGQAKVALPTKEDGSAHPVEIPLQGLRQLGATIEQHGDYIEAHADRLVGANIRLGFPSVSATENIVMAATLARGITTIESAAREPEIVDLAVALNKMGARVHGAGTDTIRVQGVDFLHGCEHAIMPDWREAGTFMLAAAVTNGDVVVQGAAPQYNQALIAKLEEMGLTVVIQEDGIRVLGTSVLIPADIAAAPYPGFPVELEAQIAVLQLLANGKSRLRVKDFRYLDKLRRMNANIQLDDGYAVLNGPTRFRGTQQSASNYQEGVALILAGLATASSTAIADIRNAEYNSFCEKLRYLGAQIDMVTTEN